MPQYSFTAAGRHTAPPSSTSFILALRQVDIMFSHLPLDIKRARLREEDHRYLTPNGAVYPSVTTILNATKPADAVDGLERWRARVGEGVAAYIAGMASKIGSEAHRLNEEYLNNKPPGPARLLSRAHHENFRPYLDRIDQIYGTEVPLYSDMLEIAGTADCIAEYDGVLSVIDYKTKRMTQQPDWVTDYYLQTAAYCMVFTEMTNITIRQCVVLVSSESDTTQEFLADPREYAGAFLLRLQEYDRLTRGCACRPDPAPAF